MINTDIQVVSLWQNEQLLHQFELNHYYTIKSHIWQETKGIWLTSTFQLLSLGGIYFQHTDDNIANLQVNAESLHFYYIFSHLNVNKSRLQVMKSVSRILATMKSLPIFLFFGFYDDHQFITYLPSWTYCKKRCDCHNKYLP